MYSFGVVLLEFLCAREAHWKKKGKLEKVIDPHLVGTINPGSLKMFRETTEKFLEEIGFGRPSMGDVLWNLEYAFQLQKISMQNYLDENSKIILQMFICATQILSLLVKVQYDFKSCTKVLNL